MAEVTAPNPGFDEIVGEDPATLTVIQAIDSFYQESSQARQTRISKNRQNRDVFLGRQDWSHKQEGQSTEFLPKVPVSVEQMSAFIKRAMVQFGTWFSPQTDNSLVGIIDDTSIHTILKCFLDNLWEGNDKTTTAANVISDTVKNGMLESLMIIKVHGAMQTTRRFVAKPGQLETDEETGRVSRAPDELETIEDKEWRLRFDLVPPENYYPDPSGRGLYEIHECERDLHEVLNLAEDGVYDLDVVNQLIGMDYAAPDNETKTRTARSRDQDETVTPSFRKRVRIREFWGTLLNTDGTVAHRNVVATVANERFLIRPPEPNPFWHQESPFIVAPLIRVPWSVWHKALYDDASSLNLAINEMFNLILDGGISAVWGVKQIRLDELEDPTQVSGGVRQGDTLAVKSSLPHGQSVMERVDEGNVPQDAVAVFQFLNSEFAQAALTNETKMGRLPHPDTKATAILEADQGQSVTLDGLVADLENNFISPMLYKAWLTILQNADRLPEDIIPGQVDKRTALILMRASPAERFALFAGKCKFKVNGISGTMAMMKDFQKIMALMQAVIQNPLLMAAYIKKYSPEATLDKLIKTLNINPNDLEMSEEEAAQYGMKMQELQAIQQILNPQQNQGESGGFGGPNAGSPGLQGQVNQLAGPATGQAPNA